MLHDCPECRKKISEHATFCPHCGAPEAILKPHFIKAKEDISNREKEFDKAKADRDAFDREGIEQTKKLMQIRGHSPLSVMTHLHPYIGEAQKELEEERKEQKRKEGIWVVNSTLSEAEEMRDKGYQSDTIESFLNDFIYNNYEYDLSPIFDFMSRHGYTRLDHSREVDKQKDLFLNLFKWSVPIACFVGIWTWIIWLLKNA